MHALSQTGFDLGDEDVTDISIERARWRSRDVRYWRGDFDLLVSMMPRFELQNFVAPGEDHPNPFLKSVVRLPISRLERTVPVGVVSNSYSLVQHEAVARRCMYGVQLAGSDTTNLKCELGLTELGEWMNLRIYFPVEYQYLPSDQIPLDLRLECFNSVDGSNRLIIMLGWLRFVCSNGMVIGETRAEFREVHNKGLDLDAIPTMICKAMEHIEADKERLRQWDNHAIAVEQIEKWANGTVSAKWGKKAACRVYHICTSGYDVVIDPPFAPGSATTKPIRQLQAVPGATVVPASNLYHVSQALTWVATRRQNAEERTEWQSNVPDLIDALADHS